MNTYLFLVDIVGSHSYKLGLGLTQEDLIKRYHNTKNPAVFKYLCLVLVRQIWLSWTVTIRSLVEIMTQQRCYIGCIIIFFEFWLS